MLCPCKSQQLYAECCEPIILGRSKALTAEALMRSRYSAFVSADINYLMSSHHSSTRPLKDKKSILAWTQSVTWLGLLITHKRAGVADDREGWVSFKASYVEKGHLECIQENSYFVKEGGLWYYKSGKQG